MALGLQRDRDRINSQYKQKRNIMKLAGIILIVIGVLALAYQGFSYTTHHEDAKLGSLEISHNETHNVWVPPLVGGGLVVAGVVVLVASGRSKI
jgi:uncharacterized membrane protein HdeD (DUF308 family)